jgi:hypothetical protein
MLYPAHLPGGTDLMLYPSHLPGGADLMLYSSHLPGGIDLMLYPAHLPGGTDLMLYPSHLPGGTEENEKRFSIARTDIRAKNDALGFPSTEVSRPSRVNRLETAAFGRSRTILTSYVAS